MGSKLLEKLIKNKTNFSVVVTNDDERNKLLSLFNSDKNIKWHDTHDKPTEWLPICPYPYYISLYENKDIVFGAKPNKTFIEIDYEDLISPKQEIHITRKDDEVHAILKENGKVIKRTVTKCHPEDEFDFKVGSKLAYDRLFEEDEEKNKVTKPKYELKVGDKVRIRQWDDMAEEFGLNKFNQIDTNPSFAQSMKPLCGQIATIIAFGKTFSGTPFIKLKFNKDELDTDLNFYSADMLEPYIPRVAKAGEYVRVIDGEDKGKIFKCTKNFWATGRFFKNREYYYSDIVLLPEEYEVLDDYTPLLNCRFIVLESNEDLTKGKIYEIKNGKFANDRGGYFPLYTTLKDENDLKKYFSSKQERVKQTGYCYDGIKFIIIKE